MKVITGYNPEKVLVVHPDPPQFLAAVARVCRPGSTSSSSLQAMNRSRRVAHIHAQAQELPASAHLSLATAGLPAGLLGGVPAAEMPMPTSQPSAARPADAAGLSVIIAFVRVIISSFATTVVTISNEIQWAQLKS